MNFSETGLFSCPACNSGKLQIIGEVVTKLWEGYLQCQTCGHSYQVKLGIPRFVPEDNYAGSFGFQWNQHARTQLDSHTGVSISRDRLFSVTGWPQRMEGERILEAGSGAGRFTEVLVATGADIYSFDYSLAVEANAQNNGCYDNLHLFQGDIFNMPFAPGGFDKVVCLGVIQHTPDPKRAFMSLARQVRPGGRLAIDVYARRLSSMLHWRFLLRPLTKRMPPKMLYRIIAAVTPLLLPLAVLLRRVVGRAGARLVPVVEFSDLKLPYELHKQWAILDTFDWYSPRYDYPQTQATVEQWFREAGFVDVKVGNGPNGIIGSGRRG
ncbi:MAG: class I SAM-dependent methyltransferase [Pseudomonadota bacterium]